MDSGAQSELPPALISGIKEALACGLMGVVFSAGYVELNTPPLRCCITISLSDHSGYMVLPFCKPTYTFGTTLTILETSGPLSVGYFVLHNHELMLVVKVALLLYVHAERALGTTYNRVQLPRHRIDGSDCEHLLRIFRDRLRKPIVALPHPYVSSHHSHESTLVRLISRIVVHLQ